MDLNATIGHRTVGTRGTQRTTRVGLGLAVLSATLVVATACGADTQGAAGSSPTTTPASTSSTSIASLVEPTITVAASPRPTATVDRLVGATAPRVHVRCTGQGDTTVVLIAGFGGDATDWIEVEPAIGTRARVCSYDRPGTGSSDPATATATFSSQATDLHDLLMTIDEPGPYVVVGHSFGGAEAVTFASLFADEVTGLVLVDASPATWPAALCAVADDGSDAAAMVRSNCDSVFLPTGNGERLDVDTAFADTSEIDSLGSLPMTVVTAVTRTLPDGLSAAEVARLTDAWDDGQQAWMSLSTDARLVQVDHTGHHIQLDQPDVVIEAITELLP